MGCRGFSRGTEGARGSSQRAGLGDGCGQSSRVREGVSEKGVNAGGAGRQPTQAPAGGASSWGGAKTWGPPGPVSAQPCLLLGLTVSPAPKASLQAPPRSPPTKSICREEPGQSCPLGTRPRLWLHGPPPCALLLGACGPATSGCPRRARVGLLGAQASSGQATLL